MYVQARAMMATGLLLVAAGQVAADQPLPGDAMGINTRACFSAPVKAGQPMTRLLLELHKEVVNDGDDPVIWAGVYGEKQGQARPGFNRDGCSPFKPGETVKLDHLICGFSCDGGTLLVKQTAQDIEITPVDLVLHSCGVGDERMGGFMVTAEDTGGPMSVTAIDDAECRKVMAPMEKIIDDAEAAID